MTDPNDNSGKFRNKYRIASARLSSWDYTSAGMYFITIVTQGRQRYFGEIENDEMILNEAGKIAKFYWSEIPNHFRFVELDEFQIMPNHLHGIIVINKSVEEQPILQQALLQTPKEATEKQHPRFRNQGKNSISAIIGSFKSIVSKYLNKLDIEFGWQTRFHDHIIRNNDEYLRISNYIVNNPALWKEDKFYL